MAPTILDAAGLEIPKHMDGKSLLKIMNKENATVKDHQAIIWEKIKPIPCLLFLVITNTCTGFMVRAWSRKRSSTTYLKMLLS